LLQPTIHGTEHLTHDLPFALLLIGMLAVFDVVASYRHQIFADVINNFGIVPDELPGLGAILSAMATRIAKVHPHDDRLVFLMPSDEAVDDLRMPI
jgi:hypothetical protein